MLLKVLLPAKRIIAFQKEAAKPGLFVNARFAAQKTKSKIRIRGNILKISALDHIKQLAIIAMVSDDDLMERLVLKGGNALDIAYKLSERASVDLDFSMEKDFTAEELKTIQGKIERLLVDTFAENGYRAFDIKFLEKPKIKNKANQEFWGGYAVEFKIIESDKHEKFSGSAEKLRRNSTVIGPGQQKTFKIDISKFEYCRTKKEIEIDGYTVYVYTPEMIMFEKLRAICQQMPEYSKIISSDTRTARARDFFDIYVVSNAFKIDITTKENIRLLKEIFNAKKVPHAFIKKIKEYKAYHEQDYDSLKDTVNTKVKLKDFDYYFDYVVKMAEKLESLGVI